MSAPYLSVALCVRSHFSFSFSSSLSPTSFFFIFVALKRYLICGLIGGGEMTHVKMQITKRRSTKNPTTIFFKTTATTTSEKRRKIDEIEIAAAAMSIMIIVTMIIIKITRAPKIESTRLDSSRCSTFFFVRSFVCMALLTHSCGPCVFVVKTKIDGAACV